MNPRAYVEPPESVSPGRPPTAAARLRLPAVGLPSLPVARLRLLPILVGLAIAALLLRLVDLIDPDVAFSPRALLQLPQAQAQTTDDSQTPAAEDMTPSADDQPPLDPDAVMDTDFSATEVALLQRLAERREALEAREAALDQREAILAAAEQRLQAKIEELTQLKADLEALMGQREDANAAKITRLVRQFETMKPADAARIFDTMDPVELVPVVEAMNERKAAPILADMTTERAQVLIRHLMQPVGADAMTPMGGLR